MRKLLLLSPPLHCQKHLRQSFQPQLNLVYLFSYLRSKAIEVELFEAASVNEAVNKIAETAPYLVGMPLYYASLDNATAIVRETANRGLKTKFVAGGPCLTMETERMMREGSFDFGIIGEGEETLFDLAEALLKDLSFDQIPGLAYNRSGNILINPRRKPLENLDQLPLLDFSAVDNQKYFELQKKAGIPQTIFLNTSRGCSFSCSYCCTPVLWPGPVRRYSPERMLEEIRHQLATFTNVEIGFCDDSFFSDKKWLNHFLQLIKPLGIRFQCIGRADHLTPHYINELADAGMSYIAFGVETGNPKRQKTLQKNLDFDRLLATMQSLAKYEIKTKCFFMLGFPDETLAEMAETINLAVKLRQLGMDFFSIFPVTVYPGTELARQFPADSFSCALDAHMPEIIRDGIEIEDSHLLDSRYNDLLTQRQMADLVTLAWNRVEAKSFVSRQELESLLSDSSKHAKISKT